MNIREAAAQINVDRSNFTGKGKSLTELIPGTTGTAERLLLYNVGKDMFLNAGGFWGTHTTTYTVGLPIILEKQENGTYTMRGPFSNKTEDTDTGDYIGLVDFQTGNNAYKQNGVFYDREKGNKSGTHWTFEEVSNSNGDVVYNIICKKEYNSIKSDYYLAGNQKMTIEVFEGGNENLVKGLTEEEKKGLDASYTQWKIVTEGEMVEQFETTYNKESPSDATFLLRAQNFNRMNRYNNDDNQDEKEDHGWKKSGKFSFSCGTDITLGNGQTAEDNGDGKYGMFYCGGIKNAEKGAKLYQTVTIKQSGWYRVDCQGFFYNDTNADKCYARLYAKDVTDGNGTNNTASRAYVDLLPKSYSEPFDALELQENQSAIVEDGIVTNKIEAGIVFYAQAYPNSLLIYINFDETKESKRQIELGIEITEGMGKSDYTYFDDFQLKYLGKSFALDEDWTEFWENGNKEEVFTNNVMILKRSLKANAWNGFTIPVNLTKQQLNTAFFPNPRLARLTEISSPETISFRLVNLKKYKDDDIVIEAGKNYIINPGYEGREGEIEIGDGNTSRITGPYYTIDRVTFRPSDVTDEYARKHTGEDEGGFGYPGKECNLTMYGTYLSSQAPTNSYILYAGDMYHLVSPYTQKGFNCWIEDEHQMTDANARHKMSLTTYLDGVSDNTTTEITDMLANSGKTANATTYNVMGQTVGKCGTDGNSLPKGIYIRNGKKIAVK